MTTTPEPDANARRDELAAGYADDYDPCGAAQFNGFIAGYDAAVREMSERMSDLEATEKVYWMNREALAQLKEQNARLAAELERLKDQVELLILPGANLMKERDELREEVSFARSVGIEYSKTIDSLAKQLAKAKAQAEALASELKDAACVMYGNDVHADDLCHRCKVLARYNKWKAK